MQNQNKAIHSELNSKNTINVLLVICTAWAMSLTIPFRREAGRNYIGIYALLVPVWIFLFAAFSKNPELISWIPVFWFGLIFNQATVAKLRRQGYHSHTYSCGDPWIGRMILFFSRKRGVGIVGEMFVIAFSGWAMAEYFHRPTLINYFLIGLIPMAISEMMAKHGQRQRDDAARDATLEQYGRFQRPQQRRW